ncbi:MAG: HNH endonuclease [Pirellulales bacterium]
MNYWFYNTDAKAFNGNRSAHRKLIAKGFAVTGGPEKFGLLLGRLEPGDTLLMYENKVGVLAVGTVLEQWDQKKHKGSWYYGPDEPHDYRIAVDWYLDFIDSPISVENLRDAIGYIPRGALKKDIHKHEQIEELLAELLPKSAKKKKSKPKRESTTILRIVRDSGIARTVKYVHGFRCQICGTRITLPDGRFYAEAHHIRPLGKHGGYDEVENLLCVCPNHHAALDYFAIPIDMGTLRREKAHSIDETSVEFHNSMHKAAKSR